MKKILAIALVLALSLCMLTACGGGTDTEEPAELTVIKVGASVAPHAEILEAAKEELAKAGYDLEIVEFEDYVLPNMSLENGELDANYFQHIAYLEDFNAENDTHIVYAAKIHYEPFGIYAGTCDSLDALENGAKVAVPNDSTNEARALLLLQQEGLIKLDEAAGLQATVKDITENPKNLEIVELEAATVPRTLGEVAVAVINGNYAISSGLSVKDALAVESGDSEAIQKQYANVLCVKEGNENNEAIQALVNALQSDAVKKFMEEKYEGAVVPCF